MCMILSWEKELWIPAVENSRDKMASSPSLVSLSRLLLERSKGGEEEVDEEAAEEEADEEEEELEEVAHESVFERFLADGPAPPPFDCFFPPVFSPVFFDSSTSESDSMKISPPTSLKIFDVSALPCLFPSVNKSRMSDWLK